MSLSRVPTSTPVLMLSTQISCFITLQLKTASLSCLCCSLMEYKIVLTGQNINNLHFRNTLGDPTIVRICDFRKGLLSSYSVGSRVRL